METITAANTTNKRTSLHTCVLHNNYPVAKLLLEKVDSKTLFGGI